MLPKGGEKGGRHDEKDLTGEAGEEGEEEAGEEGEVGP